MVQRRFSSPRTSLAPRLTCSICYPFSVAQRGREKKVTVRLKAHSGTFLQESDPFRIVRVCECMCATAEYFTGKKIPLFLTHFISFIVMFGAQECSLVVCWMNERILTTVRCSFREEGGKDAVPSQRPMVRFVVWFEMLRSAISYTWSFSRMALPREGTAFLILSKHVLRFKTHNLFVMLC